MLKLKCFASGSGGNCYLMQNEETNILIECGIEEKALRKYLLAENITVADLDCCLISHSHNDHSKLSEYIGEYTNIFSTNDLFNRYNIITPITPKKPFKVNTIKILPISVEHGKCENNAFVFIDKNSSAFFGTDFSLMEQNLSNFKFDFIAIECNFSDEKIQSEYELTDNKDYKEKLHRQISTHMSINNCIEHLSYFDLTNCKEIILLHASKYLINKNLTKELFENKFKIKTYFAKEK